MPGKFKFFIIFFFFSLYSFYPQENSKNISYIKNINDEISIEYINKIKLLYDYLESETLKNKNDIILRNFDGEVAPGNIENIISYTSSHSVDAFFYFDVNDTDESIVIHIQLFDSVGEILYDQDYNIKYDSLLNNNMFELLVKDFTELLLNQLGTIKLNENKWTINKKNIKRNFKFDHEYPLFSIGISGISTKIYFDDRMIYGNNSIFSVSPLDIRVSFYPLEFFECGLFLNFNFQNLVFRYEDIDDGNKIKYYYNYFSMQYGLFFGFSYFNKGNHYSFGFRIYNLFYDFFNNQSFHKPVNVNGLFLPQFSFYQKIDFKLLKVVHYSIIFNLKTDPKFFLNSNELYSKPFHYHLLILEIIFLGLTITI